MLTTWAYVKAVNCREVVNCTACAYVVCIIGQRICENESVVELIRNKEPTARHVGDSEPTTRLTCEKESTVGLTCEKEPEDRFACTAAKHKQGRGVASVNGQERLARLTSRLVDGKPQDHPSMREDFSGMR